MNETTKETIVIAKPKIFIGIPTMGSVHVFTMIRILKFCTDAFAHQRYSVVIYPTSGVSPVDNARNEIVTEFLKGDATHLLWIDSDTIPPEGSLDKMLKDDKDIISGITPIIEYDEKRSKSDSNGYYKKWNCVGTDNKFVMPYTGIVPIHGAGGSFLLVKRAVYEKMEKPWYRFLYKDDNSTDCFIGEDVSFIAKSISLGFKPFCDTSIQCGHSKQIIW